MPLPHHPLPAAIGALVAMLGEEARTLLSTACASSLRAPVRNTSVSGSEMVPGWANRKPLVSVTAYHPLVEKCRLF